MNKVDYLLNLVERLSPAEKLVFEERLNGENNNYFPNSNVIPIISIDESNEEKDFKDLEISNNKGIINIGYHKILYQIKKIKDKKEQNGN